MFFIKKKKNTLDFFSRPPRPTFMRLFFQKISTQYGRQLGIICMGFCILILLRYSISYWLEPCAAKVGFVVRDVLVEGRQRTSKKDLLALMKINRGDNLLSLPLPLLKEKIENLPWVRSVVIERRLPSILSIRLAERQPLALWQYQGKRYLIDHEGEIIKCSEDAFPKNLLIVVGEKAAQQAGHLLQILEKFPEIKSDVQAATYLKSERWNLYLTNKWIVKLPEQNIEKSLHHFLNLKRKYTLSHEKIMMLDLRGKDSFIVRLVPKEIIKKKQTLKALGKEA